MPRCKSCSFFGNPDYDGYCSSCFKQANPGMFEKMEKEKRERELQWQNADAEENDEIAVAKFANILSAPGSSRAQWHDQLVKYCITGRAERVRVSLLSDTLREHTLQCRNLLSRFLSNRKPDPDPVVLAVLLEDPTLRATLREERH